ncbi:MAG: hypothetical protein AAFN12_05095 [Cyanobacteria bacterium J06560_2]
MNSKKLGINGSEPLQLNQKVGDFACSFTRISQQAQPALLACISVSLASAPSGNPDSTSCSNHSLAALMRHAKELNLRLMWLKASVRTGLQSKPFNQLEARQPSRHCCLFVLQGLLREPITAQSVSTFLDEVTQDVHKFLAYAKAHHIQLKPSNERSNRFADQLGASSIGTSLGTSSTEMAQSPTRR